MTMVLQRSANITLHSSSSRLVRSLRQLCRCNNRRRWASSCTTTIKNESSAQLVDSLLDHTAFLMRTPDDSSTLHHTVAFSGGVDSSLVAYLVHTIAASAAGTTTTTTCRAILGVSPAVSQEQIAAAQHMAEHIGIPLQRISTNEGDDPMYVANAGQACFACKTHLYRTMAAIQQHNNTESSGQKNRLYNGTNADDRADTTRSGLRAAADYNVLSPLEHVSKDQVRQAAHAVQLPNAYTAAAPCLRSRLQWGVPATQAHLQSVERMERFVRKQLGVSFASAANVRVRVLAGQRICVQVDDVTQLEALYAEHREEWDNLFLTQEGFRSLELRSFESGSVASFGRKVKLQRHVAVAER